MKTLTLQRATRVQPAGATSVANGSKHRLLCCAGLALLVISLSHYAFARPTTVAPSVPFNFNGGTGLYTATGMQLSLLSGIGNGLGATASAEVISTYMTASLHMPATKTLRLTLAAPSVPRRTPAKATCGATRWAPRMVQALLRKARPIRQRIKTGLSSTTTLAFIRESVIVFLYELHQLYR